VAKICLRYLLVVCGIKCYSSLIELKNYILSNSVITNSSGPVIFVRYNRGSL
jgi:hypothetical protein